MRPLELLVSYHIAGTLGHSIISYITYLSDFSKNFYVVTRDGEQMENDLKIGQSVMGYHGILYAHARKPPYTLCHTIRITSSSNPCDITLRYIMSYGMILLLAR